MALSNAHKVDLIEAYFLNYQSSVNALKWYRQRYPDRNLPNQAYPKASLQEAAENIGVHKSTVRKVLKKHKYKCYREGRLVQALLPGDTDHRLTFCRWFVTRSIGNHSFLNLVVWTDEYNFSNNGKTCETHRSL